MARIVDKDGNIAIYGRLSWGNFTDWLVTLCLGLIILLTAVSLGGVRPDTQWAILPLFAVLLTLHGIWLAVDDASPKRLSHIPFWFVPALLWMLCSVHWFSPAPWRGWYEMIYALQAFIFLWVLANNVRSRAHLWLLIIISLAPAPLALFNGFYQFFQEPQHMLGAMTDYGLDLNSDFLGRATGAFADPNSFAAFLLILLPSLLIMAGVTRLPKILRLLALYIALIFFVGIALTQSYWAYAAVVILMAIIPWFCFRRLKASLFYSCLVVLAAALIFTAMVIFHPFFKNGLERAQSNEGEGVRLVLWREAFNLTAENPISGVGAGAYRVAFEQSPRVSLADSPETPHNDYLLVLSQLGILGVVLFGIPILYVFICSFSLWRKEPFAVKLLDRGGTIMPPQRFFLSLGLAGTIALALCMTATFVFYIPALTLYGVLMFAILVKTTYKRKLTLPVHWIFRIEYFLLATCVGWSFYVLSSTKLEAHALELRARQQLGHVVDMRVHVSGNAKLLDQVLTLYEDAVLTDPQNADAWLGRSASLCQLYFRSPGEFERLAKKAVVSAERAVEISPLYWKTWAQLGVARSFYGEADLAEEALLKALELAPKNSNAHYYYAAFLSLDSEQREQAMISVRAALDINPKNTAARRLQQKLLIL
jgi:O-antigen ligase